MNRVIVWPLIGFFALKALWPTDLYAQSFSSRVVNYFKNEKTQEVPSWVITTVGLFAGSDPDFMTTKGLMELKSGDFSSADEIFREVLSGNPINYEATFGRAKLALLRGDYDLAESSFTKANHLRPELVETYLGIAQTMIAKGEYQKASNFINESILSNKDLNELKVLQGYISIQRGSKERVEEEILDGLRLNLSSSIGLIILSVMYIENNEIDLALDTLGKVASKDKSELLLYIAYSDIYLKQKQYEDVLNSLKPLTDIQSKDHDYLVRYGIAKLHSGNMEEGEKSLSVLGNQKLSGKKVFLLDELRSSVGVYKSALASAGGDKASLNDSTFLKAKLLKLAELKNVEDFADSFLVELKRKNESTNVAIEAFGTILNDNDPTFKDAVVIHLYEKKKAGTVVEEAFSNFIENVTFRNEKNFVNSYIEVAREYFILSDDVKKSIDALKTIGKRLNDAGLKNDDVYYGFMSMLRVLRVKSEDPAFSAIDNYLNTNYLKANYNFEVDQDTINNYKQSKSYQKDLNSVNKKRSEIETSKAYVVFSEKYYDVGKTKVDNLGSYIAQIRSEMEKEHLDRKSFIYNGIMYKLGIMSKNREMQEEALNAVLKNPTQFIPENDNSYIAFMSIYQGGNVNDMLLLLKTLRSEVVKHPEILSGMILSLSYGGQEEFAYKLLEDTRPVFKGAEYENLSLVVQKNYERYRNTIVREKVEKMLPEADALMANKKVKEAYAIYLKIIEIDEGNWKAQKQAANYEHSIGDYEKANLRVSNLIVIYGAQEIKDQYLAVSIFWLCVSHGINCSMHRKELTEIKIEDELLKEEVLLKLIIDGDDLPAAKAQIAELENSSNLKKKLLATKYKHVIEAIEKKRAEEAKWKENPYLMPPTEEMQKQHEPSEATIVE